MKLNNELRKMKKRKMSKQNSKTEGEKMENELTLELVYLDSMSDLSDK